ncbi:MAG: acyl-ACP thioesterase [Tissierellia bacterium]|nr:acyl-ACP thioesterase [Tissierellia bacterium]
MAKYSKEIIVPYYDCNKNGLVRPASILSYMGEVSTIQSVGLGVGISELYDNNMAWMLNRWKVRFLEYPRPRDKIKVETWCSSIDRFYALREFAIYNMAGEKIIKASTQWVLLDTIKKRPKRVPQTMVDIYGAISEKHFTDFYDFKDVSRIEMRDVVDFHVRKSEIDYNNHVNNAKYLDWMLEAIPVEIDENHLLYELEIMYKKEIKYGETIYSSFTRNDEENTYIHKISKDDEINAFGKSKWIKK